MIVLDTPYTGALFRRAAQDDLISHHSGNSLFKDPITRTLLNKGINPLMQQSVLWDILLFGPAVCQPYDNIDAQRLISEDLITQQMSSLEVHDDVPSLVQEPEIARTFREIINREANKKYPRVEPKDPVEDYIHFSRQGGLYILNTVGPILSMFDKYEDLFSYFQINFSGPFQIPGAGSAVSGEDFAADLLKGDLSAETFEYFKQNQQRLYRADYVHDVAQKWITSTTVASRLGAQIKLAHSRRSVLKNRQSSPASTGEPPHTSSDDNCSVHHVISVIAEEVEHLPRVETFDHVRRLREDRRLVDFREALLEWANAIETGNLSEEQKLRKHLRTASESLKTVGELKRVSGIYAVLSAAADIGLIMNGISIPTSIVGAYFAGSEVIEKRKHRWIMFGTKI